MNRIYSLVWNRTLRTLQVASELAHAGKGGGQATTSGSIRRRPLVLACVAALGMAVVALPAWSANCPQGATVLSSANGANGSTGSDGNGTNGGTGSTAAAGSYACLGLGGYIGGGNGGDGAQAGGTGGAGGTGLSVAGSGTKLANNGYIYGGNGGYSYYDAAGAGGAGVSGDGFTLTNNNGIYGGRGGGSIYGAGGAGGAGVTGSNFKLINNGYIAGGNGGPSYYAAAGAGGAGVSGSGFTLTNNSGGGIYGGRGGYTYSQYGTGGNGGAGVYGSNITLVNDGFIGGGSGFSPGGEGGGQPGPGLVGLAAVQPLDSTGTPGSSGYTGGAGGAGVVATGNSTITNAPGGLIVGGEGGYGYATGVGSTGYGGAGGAGVTGSGFKLTNQGEVGGGTGGAGYGVFGVNGSNGTGGAGGVAVSGSGFYVNNSAILYGGSGGAGYAFGAATGGDAGAGIAGSGFTVVNSGLILGGRGGYGRDYVGSGGNYGYVTTGGAGGAGISVDNVAGATTTITNASNVIAGGEGGTAYEVGVALGSDDQTVIAYGGNGGAGIAIDGAGTTNVTNDGILAGGYGGYAYVCNGGPSACSTYTGHGGTGGAGVDVAGGGTTTITNTGYIYGARGGNAWSYGVYGVNGGSYTQGLVGTGGAGINVSSTGTTTIDNSGWIYGGNGGYGYGSQPAAGGAGVTGTGFTLTNSGGIYGGYGNGTGSKQGYRGGTGGAGVSGSGFTVTNTGVIVGGEGGSGNYSSGAGGAGISGSGFTVTNGTGGYIVGGNGGNYTGCSPGALASGAGGVGVDAMGRVSITNSGSIVGGLSGNGSIQADAVDLSGGGNTLTLESGYSFTGNVISTSGSTDGGDTLALGGTTNDTFDVSQIAATAPTSWSGTVQYYGFATYAKTGDGTWALTNTTTAVTPWTLAGGTLQISSDTNLGAASGGLTFNGGTLENTAAITSARDIAVTGTGTLQTDADFTSSGSVSGAGALTKTGAGTLTFNGNGSAFSGSTNVTTGTLLVGGDGFPGASLGGATTVAAGATVGGFGTLGSLDLFGSLSPGASIGTLHASGDATFEPGSTYALDITSAGQSDQFASAGAATINGGTVQVQATGSNWAPITTYTIVTAAGGVSGQFSGLSTLPTPHGGLLYGSDSVTLVLGTDAFNLGNSAQTVNQRNTAGAVSSLGWGSQLFLAVAAQDAGVQRVVLDQASGEFNASQQAALVLSSRFVREQMDRRLRDGDADDPAAKIEGTKLTAWVHGWGHWGQIDGDGNAAQISDNGDGVLVGADLPVGASGRVGFTGGAERNSLSVHDRSSWADVTQTWLGAYGGFEQGAFAFRAGVAYAWNQVPGYRDVTVPDLAPEQLSSNARGSTTTGYIEGAWRIQTAIGTIAPYLNLANVRVQSNSSNETGGAAALHMDSSSMNTTLSTLGVRGNWQLASKVSLDANLGWQHAFGDITPERTQQFLAGGDAFTVYGTPIAKNAGQVNVNVNWQVTQNARFTLGYDGLYGGGVKDSAAKASLNVAF